MSNPPNEVQAHHSGLTQGRELVDPHSFLYVRVTLYARILTIFFVAFAVIGAIKVAAFSFEVLGWLGVAAQGLFVGVAIAIAGTWVYLRRAQPSVAVLHGIESMGTVLSGLTLAGALAILPVGIVQVGIFLTVVLMLVVRAAVVPSTAVRTLWVGLLCSATVMLLAWHRTRALGPLDMSLPSTSDPESYSRAATQYMWLILGSWGAIFTFATAIVSRVIYRLTDTVRFALQLGNYTLERKLGEGGMGVVYLARHALMARPAALKLLRPEQAGEEALRRFEREVQKTSELTHPNTVRVFDFGRTPEGVFYYVMEYLDGLDLLALVEAFGPLPAGRVIHVLAQVAHALAEAHRHGLVHRDIKPSNVVLCDLGGVADMAKLLDFGLAKDIKAPTDLAVSGVGKIAGTPMYLAPESITAPSTIDGRADLYALGAVGYFLITGAHVFEAKSVVEVCGHHLHSQPVAPSERLGEPVAEDLESVLLRCLAKDPQDRYADALALRAALLACEDAGRWSMDEARVWWDDNGADVTDLIEREQESMAGGAGDTISVAFPPLDEPSPSASRRSPVV